MFEGIPDSAFCSLYVLRGDVEMLNSDGVSLNVVAETHDSLNFVLIRNVVENEEDGGDETPSPFLSIQTISSLKDNKDVSIRPTTHDFWVQEGQLVKIHVRDNEGDGQSYAFLHSANRLTRQSSDGKITDYRLDNEGKCIEVEYPDGSIETIVYNNNRHPVQYGEDVYEWQNGNLIQATCHTDYGVISWKLIRPVPSMTGTISSTISFRQIYSLQESADRPIGNWCQEPSAVKETKSPGHILLTAKVASRPAP